MQECDPVNRLGWTRDRIGGIVAGWRLAMFEKDEVLKDLHDRLLAAGIDPSEPKVQAICAVVNAYYAEKTRDVLQMMQNVLAKIQPD
jgi:hypothetical protein